MGRAARSLALSLAALRKLAARALGGELGAKAKELASSQSDLLFTVAVQSKPGLLYLLFEHQSAVDELMPLRILKYVVRILDQYVTAAGGGSKALPLPVVIPVVLHHSATGWTAPTRFEELFDPELVLRVQ